MNAGYEELVPDPRTVAVEGRPYRHGHQQGHPVSHKFWYEAGFEAGYRRGRWQGAAWCLVIMLHLCAMIYGLSRM